MENQKNQPLTAPGKNKQTGIKQSFVSSPAFDRRVSDCAKAKGLKPSKLLFIAVERYLSDNNF